MLLLYLKDGKYMGTFPHALSSK